MHPCWGWYCGQTEEVGIGYYANAGGGRANRYEENCGEVAADDRSNRTDTNSSGGATISGDVKAGISSDC